MLGRGWGKPLLGLVAAVAIAAGGGSASAENGVRDDSLISAKPNGGGKFECRQPGRQLKTFGVAGGKDADVAQFPFIVQIYVAGRKCGGALIAPGFALTAAHCVMPSPESCQYPVGGPDSGRCEVADPRDVKVFRPARSGEVDPRQVRGAKRVFAHPRFSYDPNGGEASDHALDADVALLVLDQPFDIALDKAVITADPALDANFAKGGECARVAGWGRTDVLDENSKVIQKGKVTRKLQSLNMRIVAQERCQKRYPGQISRNMMCVGDGIEGKNTCKGDSGGPLVVDVGGKPILVGLVSWAYGCAREEEYTIFTRVGAPEVRGWINQTIYEGQ